MDLTIDVEDYKLNIRAGAIIIHNNKLLIHNDTNFDFYGLLGGRVGIGEDSKTALIREIKEELAKNIEITGYIGTIENFFEHNGKKYHEIQIVHKAEFIDEKDKMIEETLKNVEGKEELRYDWIDLEKIDEYPLKPEIMKKVLKEKIFPVHEVQRDKNV